jgi:ureidoacrylate peracid hydrolase
VCVESTARNALQANFRVVVVADACADLTCDAHNASLCAVAQWVGDVRLASEVITELA